MPWGLDRGFRAAGGSKPGASGGPGASRVGRSAAGGLGGLGARGALGVTCCRGPRGPGHEGSLGGCRWRGEASRGCSGGQGGAPRAQDPSRKPLPLHAAHPAEPKCWALLRQAGWAPETPGTVPATSRAAVPKGEAQSPVTLGREQTRPCWQEPSRVPRRPSKFPPLACLLLQLSRRG